jgi:hypothetical protein
MGIGWIQRIRLQVKTLILSETAIQGFINIPIEDALAELGISNTWSRKI